MAKGASGGGDGSCSWPDGHSRKLTRFPYCAANCGERPAGTTVRRCGGAGAPAESAGAPCAPKRGDRPGRWMITAPPWVIARRSAVPPVPAEREPRRAIGAVGVHPRRELGIEQQLPRRAELREVG